MIVAIASIITFFLGLYRFQWALIWFIFCLPFFPRSIAVAIGSSGLALTQRRAGVIILFGMFFVYLIVNNGWQKKIIFLIKKQRLFFFILSSLLILKLTSTLINSGASSLIYVTDEILFSIFILFSVFVSINTFEDEKKFILIMILGFILSGLLTGLDQVKEAPLLQGVIDVEVATSKEDVLASRERGDHFRSQALFDNPLLLSEFACLVMPFLLLGMKIFSSRKKYFILIALFFLPFIIWSVYARSGLVVALAGLIAF